MDFVTIAQTLGIPVTCMVAMGTAIWAVLKWTATNVVKPVTERHLLFMDKVDVAMDKLMDNSDKLSARLDQMDGRISEIKSIVVRASNVSIIPDKGGISGQNQGFGS